MHVLCRVAVSLRSKVVSDPLELDYRMTVSHLMWVLGIELRLS